MTSYFIVYYFSLQTIQIAQKVLRKKEKLPMFPFLEISAHYFVTHAHNHMFM